MDLHSVRVELAGLWQASLERVLHSLLASGARSTDAEAPALHQLQRLRSFLCADSAPGLQLAESAPEQLQSGVAQLCVLLQSQAYLPGMDTASASNAGTALVQQRLQQRLLQVAQGCRSSEWTLAHYVASGLAQQCRELRLLGCFSGDSEFCRRLARVEQRLMLWHAATQAPAPSALAHLQQHLLALRHDKPGRCAGRQTEGLSGCVAQPAPLVLDAPALAELRLLHKALQPALQPRCDPSERMVIASYRLTWVLQALGADSLAAPGMLLYQLLVRHWQQREALSAQLQALLEAWLALLPLQSCWQPAALEDLLPCMSDAVALWPDRADEQGAAVQLWTEASLQTPDLTIRRVPEHLAVSLQSLLQVQAGWFVDCASWERCRPLLLRELHLLEQGAAALRLSELEHFSSHLLAFHAQLDLRLPGRDWPAATLWHAHRELVATLDRAALWQEPLLAAEAQHALHAGLQCGEACLQAALHDGSRLEPGLRLAAALSLFAQQAGRLLGRSARIQLHMRDLPPRMLSDIDEQLQHAGTVAVVCPLLHTLQQCLRWLLLQPDSSAESRRSRRVPQASAISIAVTLVGQAGDARAVAAGFALSLMEQGTRGVPDNRALQRLQRSLGPAVQHLRCEEVLPQGRRLALHLLKAV